MPNWCENVLVVAGPDAAVDAFVAAAADPDPDEPTALSLDRLVPIPAELDTVSQITDHDERRAREEAMLAKYGCIDGFSWRVATWGTKWDVEAEPPARFTVGAWSGARYQFSSAWSPPTEALVAASAAHPQLTLRLSWNEPGCGEAAYVVIRDGVTVDEVEVDVPAVLGELVVDTDGRPVTRLDAYTDVPATTDDVVDDVVDTVLALLRAAVPHGPDPRVLVTCWDATALPEVVVDRLGCCADLVVDGDGNTLLVALSANVLTDALIGDGLAAAWYEALYESWDRCGAWLPENLARRSVAFAAAAPTETLAAQVAVCFDLDPAEATTVAAEIVALGVDAASATRFVLEVSRTDAPPVADLVTIVAGALLGADDLPGAATPAPAGPSRGEDR